MGANSQSVKKTVNESNNQIMGVVTPGRTQSRNTVQEVRDILDEGKTAAQKQEDREKSIFKLAYNLLTNMQNGKTPFVLKDAIFAIENAYSKNSLNKQLYMVQIDSKVQAVKSLFRQHNVAENDHFQKNYQLQKLFGQSFEFDTETGTRFHQAFAYDHEDFFGEKDWTKMFVSKLLTTGTGQCHSLPLLYLILAQETNTKAWLSLAPEHSYIVFSDEKMRDFQNFETTNGNLVSDQWLMASGYVNANAIKSSLYLDTLSQSQLIGTLIADLTMSYINLFGYDDFVLQMNQTLLNYYPNSLQGQIFKADILALQTQNEYRKANNPPLEEFKRNKKYIELQEQYSYLDESGYMPMSKEKYQTWLKSFKKSSE